MKVKSQKAGFTPPLKFRPIFCCLGVKNFFGSLFFNSDIDPRASPWVNDRDYKFKSCGGLKQQSKFSAGFTMLETIVAIAILLAATMGPVTLITRGLFGSTFSKNKIVALHLAEEGIELVRNIRENNKLCQAVDATGWEPPGGWRRSSDGTGTMVNASVQQTIDATNLDSVTCGPGDAELTFSNPHLSSPCSEATGPKLLRDSNGRYGYISGPESIFTRCLVIIQPISEDVQTGPPDIPGIDILDVTATIFWQERNIPRSVILRERIYNWESK